MSKQQAKKILEETKRKVEARCAPIQAPFDELEKKIEPLRQAISAVQNEGVSEMSHFLVLHGWSPPNRDGDLIAVAQTFEQAEAAAREFLKQKPPRRVIIAECEEPRSNRSRSVKVKRCWWFGKNEFIALLEGCYIPENF